MRIDRSTCCSFVSLIHFQDELSDPCARIVLGPAHCSRLPSPVSAHFCPISNRYILTLLLQMYANHFRSCAALPSTTRVPLAACTWRHQSCHGQFAARRHASASWLHSSSDSRRTSRDVRRRFINPEPVEKEAPAPGYMSGEGFYDILGERPAAYSHFIAFRFSIA